MRLSWTIDKTARKALETELFGKRLFGTDHDDWTIAEVVAGYRSQNDVESGFRQLKDPHLVGFSPMFHWTDPKIRVHDFYGVLALAVAHLMRREAQDAGLNLSVRELLANLSGIEEWGSPLNRSCAGHSVARGGSRGGGRCWAGARSLRAAVAAPCVAGVV